MTMNVSTPSTAERFGPVARPGAEERSYSAYKAFSGFDSVWAAVPATSSRDHSTNRTAMSGYRTEDTAQQQTRTPLSRDSGANTNGLSKVPSFQPTQTSSLANPWSTNSNPGWSKTTAQTSPTDRQSNGLLQGSFPFPSAKGSGWNNQNGPRLTESPNDPLATSGKTSHLHQDSNGSTQYQSSLQSWTDGGSVHSPTDERRRYFEGYNPFSSVSSRNPSQPPSRGRNEPANYPQAHDTAPALLTNRGHNASISSLSSGRFAQERNHSIHSEGVSSLYSNANGAGMEEELQRLSLNHTQSHDGQFPAPFYPSNSHARTPITSQLIERPPQSNGYFTPESAPTMSNHFQSKQFELHRGAFTPAASDLRPPYFSTAATPGAQDGSVSASSQIGRTNAAKLLADPIALELRLRSLQQQRHANGLHLQQFQPHLQANLNLHRQHLGGYADMATLQQALTSGVLLTNNMMSPQMPMYTGQLNYSMLDGLQPSRQEVHRASVMSSLLSEFKASASKQDKDNKNQYHQHNQYSQPARQWHLQDVASHVAEFCGDQQGSRFIQNKLEQANSDEKEMVFREIMPDLVALMQDVFGNYVVQKFFDHGDMRQKAEMANAMKGNLFKLSKQMYACRVVQKAIDHILTAQRVELINELKYDIVELSTNMNGNHVIQKAVEAIPASKLPFVITAFSSHCHDLSRHMYGCRVIQRVLEHCDEPVKREILDKLHMADDLIDDQYGNYVTQHMIEYGSEQDRKLVNQTLIKNIIHFSTHKFASNVVEKCFEFADEQTKHDMMMAVINHQGPQGNGLTHFSRDQFGNYVTQTMFLHLSDADYLILFDKMEPVIAHAERTNLMGKHIVAVKQRMYMREDLLRRTNRTFIPQPPMPPPDKQEKKGHGHNRSGGNSGVYGHNKRGSNDYGHGSYAQQERNGHGRTGSGSQAYGAGTMDASVGASPTTSSFSQGYSDSQLRSQAHTP